MSEPLDLDAVEALAEAATWRRIHERHGIESLNESHVDCICGWSTEPTPKPGLESLARLFDQHVAEELARSCSAVPALVARVREAEAALMVRETEACEWRDRASVAYETERILRARLEAAERERDEAKRFSFQVVEQVGEPKRATILVDGVPIFTGRDCSADIASHPDTGGTDV